MRVSLLHLIPKLLCNKAPEQTRNFFNHVGSRSEVKLIGQTRRQILKIIAAAPLTNIGFAGEAQRIVHAQSISKSSATVPLRRQRIRLQF
jgi:hypothetical protein